MTRTATAVTVVALMMLSVASLVDVYFALPGSSAVAGFAFVLLCLGIVPSFGIREWALAAIALSLFVGLLLRPEGMGVGLDDARSALDRAAFFAAFIYLVTLLKEAAQSSASVMSLGTWLTQQPGGRRYYSLALGGHVMGLVLNFGAISLITPLIQRGVAHVSDATQRAALEQQQISALVRGFSWMIMWSPTALTQAVLFTMFPSADMALVIALGLTATVTMIAIGRVEDRWRWRGRLIKTTHAPAFPRRAAKRFLCVCGALIFGTFLVVKLASVVAAIALMLVAPILICVWVLLQRWQAGEQRPVRAATTELTSIVGRSSTVLGRVAVTLGAAGFIGEAAARLAPIDHFAHVLQTWSVPDWLFLMSLPIIINLCGQIALSPLLVVVFLASVINQLPALPADPSLIVFALAAGWALSMSASPNASASLLISGVTGTPPTTLTWRWNGRYALMCAAVFMLSFYLLTRVLSP